ncbi:NADH-quinone oxidoreductase subunit NuoE [candidate division NPL-UPA2 bacterium Unc8]|uniref:NADH-quinone oxidoreductase subunit NuoE n=1 Tax=candidate division NPL-UPA2 bacterium Unc8 TaxID=1980939 RepID=A0A399FZI2_UNCN2|nr:MAG: NADH-quinone oxidoreductase subunit NuoE [candidate division NPL-UPA2 bacterium Unc8]
MNKINGEIYMQNKEQKELLVRLGEAQNKFGYLSEKVMIELAESLDMSISDVYGVATFYSFFSIRPQGRNIIRICKSVPCFLKNSQVIIETVEKEIGIKPGETTPNGKFSFHLTNCIGVCDKAPAMMINSEVYIDLTPNKISQILKAHK